MRKLLVILAVMALCGCAWAKHIPDSAYQPGTLIAVRTVVAGSSCSNRAQTDGNVNARTDDSGNTSGTVQATTYGSSSCADNSRALYTVQVAGQRYVIARAITGKETSAMLLTLGWGAMAMKASVLANQLPGTRILVRSDPSGLYVKLGKRESKYNIVEAR